MLKLFKRTLLEHVHEENLKLYIYLQSSLEKSSAQYLEIRGLRKEMDTILIAVLDFFNTYEQISKVPRLQASFPGNFQNITQHLLRRTNTEENTLYPMYSLGQGAMSVV